MNVNWLTGLGIAVVGIPLAWVVARFLLNRYRAPILKFAIDKILAGYIGDYVDSGIDWVRDHQDKETAKILRSMAAEGGDRFAKKFREKLYDGD